jgi:hypothetical protein
MRQTVLAIAFAVASIPMFAAQANPPATPSTPPAAGTQAKPVAKTHKHKKAVKKVAPKNTGTTGSTAAK